MIQRLQDFMRSQLREFTFMGPKGRFVQEPEYPEEVWCEGIVNAVVHRSYSLTNTPVIVELYDDRLEIKSPGDYPAGVHPREFIHSPRNPHLMEAMRYLRFVRMLTEGSLRMRQEMERANLPNPEFSKPGKQYVLVTLRNDIERRVKERSGVGAEVSQFLNLFRITWRPADDVAADESEEVLQAPEPGEIREVFLKGLKAQGFAVDSFFKDSVADLRREHIIPKLKNSGLASIYPGFRFRILRLSDGVYLLLDYTVHVRNRATLARLLEVYPKIRSRDLRKGFVQSNGTWMPCLINAITENQKIRVTAWADPSSDHETLASEVIPLLPTTWIA